MTDLFTYQENVARADIAKEAGIASADRNAWPEWKREAMNALEWVASMRPAFTSQDVFIRMDSLNMDRPHEPSAMGSIFRHAAKIGMIVKTGRHVPSQLAHCHRDVVEWKLA